MESLPVSTLLLIVLAAALTFAVVKMKAGEAWARPATAVLAALVVLLALVRVGCRRGRPDPQVDLAAASSFEEARARIFARALGKHMRRGSSALVFAMTEGEAFHSGLVGGLEKGFEPYGIKVAEVRLPIPEAQQGRQRQQQSFEAALASHPDLGGVVIYGNPVADMESVTTDGKQVKLGIMVQRLDARAAVGRVKAGTATAVVVVRANVDWASVTRIRDPERRFRKTYLVVTPESVAEIEKGLR
jgi:hypothetical protein